MASKETTKTSGDKQIVAQEGRKRPRRASTVSLTSNVANFGQFCLVMRKLCAYYGIGQGGIDLLFLLHDEWVKRRKGLTMTAVCKRLYGAADGTNTRAMYYKRDALIERGLVEYIGSGKHHSSKLYAPTVKAINELSKLVVLFMVEDSVKGSRRKVKGDGSGVGLVR